MEKTIWLMSKFNHVYFRFLAEQSKSVLKYVGIVDKNGNELDYTNYKRQSVEWEVAEDGTMTPTKDLVFDIPGSGNEKEPIIVAGWRLYDKKTGGTDFGGKDVHPAKYVTNGHYIMPRDKVFVHFTNVGVSEEEYENY